jgi:hypothetical protein
MLSSTLSFLISSQLRLQPQVLPLVLLTSYYLPVHCHPGYLLQGFLFFHQHTPCLGKPSALIHPLFSSTSHADSTFPAMPSPSLLHLPTCLIVFTTLQHSGACGLFPYQKVSFVQTRTVSSVQCGVP